MLDKVIAHLTRILETKGNLDVVDEFGDRLSQIKVFNGKLILASEHAIGICKDCGGPIYNDNKTSFKYVCTNENISKLKHEWEKI